MSNSLPDSVLSHDMWMLQLNIEAAVRCGQETNNPALTGFFANTAAATWAAHRIFRALVAVDPAKAAEIVEELEDAENDGEYMELAAEHAEQAGIDVAEFADQVRASIAKAVQPELATWAEQLQSADLTPHPAFACRSTKSGYEAAMQVATTDQLTIEARERLLAALQVAFDETVRRVLGYRPATAPTV